MQTFLPYPSFVHSAQCLDYKRLGKQRVEAWQILLHIIGQSKTKAWANHPAVRMWDNCPRALSAYGLAICTEWISRGYNDNMCERFSAIFNMYSIHSDSYPEWIGNEIFHLSHQSNLLRKFPEHYKQFNWEVDDNLPYYWPK